MSNVAGAHTMLPPTTSSSSSGVASSSSSRDISNSNINSSNVNNPINHQPVNANSIHVNMNVNNVNNMNKRPPSTLTSNVTPSALSVGELFAIRSQQHVSLEGWFCALEMMDGCCVCEF